MVVHIVDVSSPSREKQETAVTGVLEEMGVIDKPRLTLWNKLDMLPEEEQVLRYSCYSWLCVALSLTVVFWGEDAFANDACLICGAFRVCIHLTRRTPSRLSPKIACMCTR